MTKYAYIKNDVIVNIAKFDIKDELPDGWIDVTDVICNISDPVVGDVPIPRPSQYHTFSGSDWEITPENQLEKDKEEAENKRINEIETEKKSAGLKKITVKQAHAKIDKIFENKTTVAQLRNACIQAFKMIIAFIIK